MQSTNIILFDKKLPIIFSDFLHVKSKPLIILKVKK
jgi:hypothetical protein